MRKRPLPKDDEPDAYGTTEGEPEMCWECDGTGESWGTCLTCGGFGWLRPNRPDPSQPTDAKPLGNP